MKRKVISRFRDKDTKVVYKKNDIYEGNEKRVAHLVKRGRLEPSKSNDKKQEVEQEKANDMKHVGGGWYEISNGERVKGKEKAQEAMNNE